MRDVWQLVWCVRHSACYSFETCSRHGHLTMIAICHALRITMASASNNICTWSIYVAQHRHITSHHITSHHILWQIQCHRLTNRVRCEQLVLSRIGHKLKNEMRWNTLRAGRGASNKQSFRLPNNGRWDNTLCAQFESKLQWYFDSILN
jgi:hypothetical protein